jgi:RecJ-like exonuclease
MKAEDAKALWPQCGDAVWFERHRDIMIAYARACERHGVERAKACPVVPCTACLGLGHTSMMENCPRCNGSRGELDWSALDAELEKENE